MGSREHWDRIYETKQPHEVSWYTPHLETSLRLVMAAAPDRDAQIIDVGAGEATFVDDLLAHGYRHLHAMDISATALDTSRARLGAAAAQVDWLCGNVLSFPFARHGFDVWHDRAVFHFLTDAAERAAYVRQVMRAVKPLGRVIVATFGPHGPAQCSGLAVMRYDADALHDEFGTAFRLLEHATELHHTPKGLIQQFTYCYCRLETPPEHAAP